MNSIYDQTCWLQNVLQKIFWIKKASIHYDSEGVKILITSDRKFLRLEFFKLEFIIDAKSSVDLGRNAFGEFSNVISNFPVKPRDEREVMRLIEKYAVDH